jgi:hypothetical protein
MSTLRSLIGLLLVVAALYAGWQIAQPYYANFQFEEAIEDAARAGTVDAQRSEQDILNEVLNHAQELKVPIKSEAVQVQRINNEVLVWGEYTVHVDLPIHPIDLHFQPASKSKKRSM